MPASHPIPARQEPRPRAPSMARNQQGASPCRTDALRSVTERHCAAARQGGEPREVNRWSAAKANPIRPRVSVSLRGNGEARTSLHPSRVRQRIEDLDAHPAGVAKSAGGAHGSVVGSGTAGRLRAGRRETCRARVSAAGVRGSIRARKRRNGRGAKGAREVEARTRGSRTHPWSSGREP